MQTRQDKKTESWIKPRFWTYDLHSLHGQFSGSHFLIRFLKACNVSLINSLGKIFQIFRPINEILSVQQNTLLTSRLFLD